VARQSTSQRALGRRTEALGVGARPDPLRGYDAHVNGPLDDDEIARLSAIGTVEGHLAVPPAFDYAGARDRLGGDVGLLAEIARVFLADAPRILLRIDEAIVAMDPVGLQTTAHELGGAAGNVGASALADVARTLEACGRDRALHAAARGREQLHAVMDELVLALNRFLVETTPGAS
jgi:HPt (histidine-containing phosphotransfer) domain-containing protein